MSLHWRILRRCLTSPFRTAAVDDQRAYRAVDIVVGAFHAAAYIREKCASPTVGVLLPTGGAFPIAALGAWIAGKVVVPLNYLLKHDELQYVVDDCGTDLILTAQPLLDFMNYEPKAKTVARLDKMNFRSVPEPVAPGSAADDELAVLLYTSGTSGKPKGVMLTHGNIGSNIDQIREHVALTKSDVVLGVLPQFHSFGLTVLTLMPLIVGLKVVYSARFVPQRIVKLIREHRPTIMVGIPSMYNALLAVKESTPDDFSSLRITVSGGEPLPDATFARFRERFGVTLNEGYGLTETGPVSNWCRPHEWRPHSVGRALPGIDQRIIDPGTGQTLGPGRDGEVVMRGPNVMRGYYKLPEETAKAIDASGFLRTGDQGRMDQDGHLFITGRIKEMIIVGGENVFPREIEEVLNRHQAVNASGVIGVTDPLRGEQPVAFVETKEGAAFDEHELLRWCREHLAGYKVPASIRHVQTLPRNPTGKIMRRELKPLV